MWLLKYNARTARNVAFCVGVVAISWFWHWVWKIASIPWMCGMVDVHDHSRGPPTMVYARCVPKLAILVLPKPQTVAHHCRQSLPKMLVVHLVCGKGNSRPLSEKLLETFQNSFSTINARQATPKIHVGECAMQGKRLEVVVAHLGNVDGLQ